MRIQKTYWIEPDIDIKLIGRIQQFGQTRLGKVTDINVPTISRWIHCGIGMREDWYKQIIRSLARVRYNKKREVLRIKQMSGEFRRIKRKVVGVQ